jgi:anti-sigma regulatory factor (Ser/Thr protein kinase)
MTMTGDGQHSLVHSALFYHSEREYVDLLVPVISEWLSMAQPVLISVPGRKMALLRDALDAVAGDVTDNLVMVDITEVGRNPGRLLGIAGSFVQRHRNRPVGIIGEPVWPGRTAAEYPACVQHEALVNIALAGDEVTGLCPYDASRLADSALADARLTHPMIWQGGSHRHNPEYAVDVALLRSNEPLTTSPAAVTYTVCELADLRDARRCCNRYARLLGMSADRVADVQLIATELATNSLRHTGGACRLAFWYQDEYLVCEARDIGQLADPLAGRRPSQSGLFVVNAVADLVRTYTCGSGTTIQAYVRLDRFADESS